MDLYKFLDNFNSSDVENDLMESTKEVIYSYINDIINMNKDRLFNTGEDIKGRVIGYYKKRTIDIWTNGGEMNPNPQKFAGDEWNFVWSPDEQDSLFNSMSAKIEKDLFGNYNVNIFSNPKKVKSILETAKEFGVVKNPTLFGLTKEQTQWLNNEISKILTIKLINKYFK
jgi:hypothetical protein